MNCLFCKKKLDKIPQYDYGGKGYPYYKSFILLCPDNINCHRHYKMKLPFSNQFVSSKSPSTHVYVKKSPVKICQISIDFGDWNLKYTIETKPYQLLTYYRPNHTWPISLNDVDFKYDINFITQQLNVLRTFH